MKFNKFSHPISVGDYLNGSSVERVEVYSVNIESMNVDDIEVDSFYGSFRYIDDTVIPLDADYYDKNMLVYGFRQTEDALQILVDT